MADAPDDRALRLRAVQNVSPSEGQDCCKKRLKIDLDLGFLRASLESGIKGIIHSLCGPCHTMFHFLTSSDFLFVIQLSPALFFHFE